MNDLELEFVPCAEALELKELGFDEPCFAMYNRDKKLFIISPTNQISFEYLCTPTFSQAFRWFREKYNLDSFCRQTNLNGWSYFKISKIETDEIIKGYSNFNNSYKEVELACLRKLISIIKELKNHETTKTKH